MEELLCRHIGLVGNLEQARHLNIHISLLGQSPRRTDQTNGELSSPDGFSVNDGIAKEDHSFHYMFVDWAVEQITHLGQGVLLT